MRYYALRDEKAGYDDLRKFPSDEFRKRAFEHELNNPESMICLYKNDYSIWFICDVDYHTGAISEEEKHMIAEGSSYYAGDGKVSQS